MSESIFNRETTFKVVQVAKILTTVGLNCQVPSSDVSAALLQIQKSEYGSINITTIEQLELIGNILDAVFDANEDYFLRPSYETVTPETYSDGNTDKTTDAFMLGALAIRLNLDVSTSIVPPATSTDVSSHGFRIRYRNGQIELSDTNDTLYLAVSILQAIYSTHYKHFC